MLKKVTIEMLSYKQPMSVKINIRNRK